MCNLKYQKSAHKWGVFEVEMTGPADGNPFVEQEVSVKFCGKHETVTCEGFYDGNRGGQEMDFGKDFVWGAATAACQIEGAAHEDGKGPNIWDVFAAQKGNVFEDHTPEQASDHYHHWKEDVAIMKFMGLKAYRFSISWARILPERVGEVNQKGIDFYNSLIDELVANGIEPYITLYHWDLPVALHLQGGWSNRKYVDWFAEYAKVVAENFSDRVKYCFTFNEPQAFVGLGYLLGMHAPGYKVSAEEGFLITHHILLAHGAAVKALREYGKQRVYIGMASCGDIYYPASNNPEDIEAAREKMFSFQDDSRGLGNVVSWFGDPVYLGQLECAIDDGVPVKGYFAWSLMDNFEWASGYAQRFGLIYVDYQTKKRIWKDSAYWYRDWINQKNLL